MSKAAELIFISLKAATRNLYDSHPDDGYEKLIHHLEVIIRSNPGLQHEAFKIAADYMIRQQSHKQRDWAMRPPKEDDVSGLYAMAETRLLDTRLGRSDGLRLAEATKKEVLVEADFYQKLSDTNGNKARWMNLIASKLSGRKKVKSVLSEKKIRELAEKAGL